jgi:hypothetical protein
MSVWMDFILPSFQMTASQIRCEPRIPFEPQKLENRKVLDDG